MELFPERLVADLERLNGASHTYLKQVCGAEQGPLRESLRKAVNGVSVAHRDRAIELLSSLDNRRFFQGFAEVVTLTGLGRAGWDLTRLHRPGPQLEMCAPGGTPWVLSVMAFLHQVRPGGELSSRELLLRCFDATAEEAGDE